MNEILNIVIPVYNEGQNIRETLSSINNKIKQFNRIFIVYDFDEDNTIPAVKSFVTGNNNIYLIKNKYEKGVLNAIKTGFENIDQGAVLVVMADFSDDLGKVDEMFEKINMGYDIVCGSRYIKGGKQIGGPKFKGILSRAAGISLNFLTGIPTHDISNSFKMYKKKVISDVNIESNGGFELGMEIVVKAFLKGYKITEVPTEWRGRTSGRSRFKLFKWLPKYLYWYFFALNNHFLKKIRTVIQPS